MSKLFRTTITLLGLLGSIHLAGCKHFSQNSSSEITVKPVPTTPYVQSIQRGDTLKITLATDSCFEQDGYTLRSVCKPELLHIAKILNSYGDAPIMVAGYTDNVASPSAAKMLSKQQADSIVAYLWAHGNAYSRFRTIGYGAAQSIATNFNPAGSYYNRHIEITTRKS